MVGTIYGLIASWLNKEKNSQWLYIGVGICGTLFGIMIAGYFGINSDGFDFVTLSFTFYAAVVCLFITRLVEGTINKLIQHRLNRPYQQQTTHIEMVKSYPRLSAHS